LESQGRCDELETQIRTKTGRELPVLISACKLGFDGEAAIITNAHDISNRKHMERALAESENRLRETQELAKLGTWEYNLETEEISWSDETFRIIGLSKESGEPSLEGFLSTVHPDDAPLFLTLINKAREDGSPYQVEMRHRQSSGRYKSVFATGKPQFEAGKAVLLFGSVMDISEFREL
jgi:PAS domain S-box-containing protein